MAETEKPRISDADMLARFQGSKKRPPCSDTLGMTLVEVRLRPGAASVEARILKLGKSAAFMEAECLGPEGELVAKATATAIPMLFKRLG